MAEANMQEVVPVKKKLSYRTIALQALDSRKVAHRLGGVGRCAVAIDIAKEAMVAGFADAKGTCVSLVRFSHPNETVAFLTLLTQLREEGLDVEVAMEPTGVYGDALRYQLAQLDFPVFRVDPFRVRAFAAALDGVPSQHDPKACTLIAHLHAQGLSTKWREKTSLERDMRTLIDERDIFARPFERCVGQVEAIVARHFPELSVELDPSRSWHLHLLARYPSPAHVAVAPEEVSRYLRKVTHGKLSNERIAKVVTKASRSIGVPMSEREAVVVSALASYMLDLRARMRDVDRRIRKVVASKAELAPMAAAIGSTTTAAIIADAGNPAEYASSAAFEKALGLNLKVDSSGRTSDTSPLHITKRGPSRARRYLYLAALRLIAGSDIVRAWYEARAAFKARLKTKAVVAVMRKLARALVHVAKGQPLVLTRLFDVRRLSLPSTITDALQLPLAVA